MKRMAVQYNRLWKLLIDNKDEKIRPDRVGRCVLLYDSKAEPGRICEPGGFGADLPGAPL